VEEDEQMPIIDPSNWQQIDISSIEKQFTNVNIASPSTITMKHSNSTDDEDNVDRNKIKQLKFNKANKLNKRSVIFSQENNPTEMPTKMPTKSTKVTSNFHVNQNANGNSILQSQVNINTSDLSSSSSSSDSSTSTKSSKSYSKHAKSRKSSRLKKKLNQTTRSIADKDDKKYWTLVKTLMREAKSYDLKSSRREKFRIFIGDLSNIVSSNYKTTGLLGNYPVSIPIISKSYVDRSVKSLLLTLTSGQAKLIVSSSGTAVEALTSQEKLCTNNSK
jgi:hypothetical protein